jgi:hypothetical protein
MKKWLLALVVMLGFAASANAQSFGVKLIGAQYNSFDPGRGTGFQITLGTLFVSTDIEFNLILGRIPLSDDNKLTFYYGAGAHAGFLGFLGVGGVFGFGAHGVLGLEYLLQPSLSLGLALHPGVSLYLGSAIPVFFYYSGGLFLNFKI